MNVDAITLAAVADEWRALLTGARIDTIIAPTGYAIAVQCYAPGAPAGQGQMAQGGQNRWLYLSAHPQLARVHLTALKPARIDSEPPAFVMLLRKYLEGTRIASIVQPRWERIIELVASHRAGQDAEEQIRYRLIIEVMGRMSNIIFCDEQGRILGSLKHVGADINRYRVIAPNVPYVPPPPQQRAVAGQSLPRLDPATVTAGELQQAASEEKSLLAQTRSTAPAKPSRKARQPEQPLLWQLLTKHLSGFGQLIAREAVYRTTGSIDAPLPQDALAGVTQDAWDELAWNVRDLASLLDTRAWRPQLVERSVPGAAPAPLAFAPYALEQFAEMPGVRARAMPTINAAIDEYYAGAEWRDAMESVRAPVRRVLQSQLERCRRKAGALRQQLTITEEAGTYRLWGDLLLAHQQEIRQGQASAVLQNYFAGDEGAPAVTVPLDPRFDAAGNANRLFHKYHKLRRALELIPGQIEQNAVELATVEQLLTDLALAETPAEAALVKAEVQEAGYLRGKKVMDARKASQKGKGSKQGKGKKGKPVPPGGGVPLHVQSRDGFTMLIGKNSRQNEEVTFRQAASNDVWLHARGVPGAHVIIKAGGRDIPRSTIAQAASLAAYYSQARGSTNVPVDYTLQRHVRHMKGGGPGMVIYERERTLYAEPSASLAQ
jgi:predicted ribosome quality control (RQC) complex YloA/Tae2 family protein